MTRAVTATTRIQRLLSMLQWIAERPDGVRIAEVAERFGLATEEVVAELEMALMIGPEDSIHYDEMPFAVAIEGDVVSVALFSFTQPLRLTAAEGLALLASADALLGAEGGGEDDDSPLRRALTKLSAAMGLDSETAIDIDVEPEGGEVGLLLQSAIDEGRRVRFTYWSYARDVVAPRLIEPWWLTEESGSWYLTGLDVEKGEERRFRLDRMEDVEVTDEPAKAKAGPRRGVGISDGSPEVVLDLPADAAWVVEAYPVVESHPTGDGRLEVRLAVAGRSWLERLLMRLGPDARIVEIDAELGGPDLLAEVAARVLDRYRA